MAQIIPQRQTLDIEEYSKIRAEVSERIEQEDAVRSRDLWQRLKLWWRIERETSRELKRRHPREDPHTI